MHRRFVIIGLALAAAIWPSFSVHTQTNPALSGEWSPVQGLPYKAIQAALLPNGNVFFWASYDDADHPQLWDPNTTLVTAAARAGYNIFCAGFCLLPNGKLFLAGGHELDFYGLSIASTYDPVSDSWTRLASMVARFCAVAIKSFPLSDHRGRCMSPGVGAGAKPRENAGFLQS